MWSWLIAATIGFHTEIVDWESVHMLKLFMWRFPYLDCFEIWFLCVTSTSLVEILMLRIYDSVVGASGCGDSCCTLSGSSEELICNPEDVEASANCTHDAETVCSKCHIPICNECWSCMFKNQPAPKALANDNFIGYMLSFFIHSKVTWIEACPLSVIQKCLLFAEIFVQTYTMLLVSHDLQQFFKSFWFHGYVVSNWI